MRTGGSAAIFPDSSPLAVDDQLADQTVLVTGASGFLGAPLTRRLLAADAEVHAVSRTAHDGALDGLRWWQVDMEQADDVDALVRQVKPAIVFHLGGHVTAAPEVELVESTFRSLLASTVNLLGAVTATGCRRLVLTGSLEEPRGDAAITTPSSPYAAAKWAACGYARMFHRLYRTPTVIVRPFYTYGPAQPEHRVIPYAILCYLRGVQPRLSSARRRLDWVYVDDLVEGLLRAGCRPGLEGATIDLGSGQAVSVRDVVLRIKDLTGSSVEPTFGVEPDRPADETRVADTAHAFGALGWRAATGLDTGLARTIAWYRDRLPSEGNQP